MAVAVTGRKGSIPPVVNTLLVVGYNAGYKLGGLPIYCYFCHLNLD